MQTKEPSGVKIQIYTMQTPEEARVIAALGVDHIGVTPASRGLPGEIDFATARAIFDALPDTAVKVALSVEEDTDAIIAMARATQPDILHLCAEFGAVPPDAIRALRAQIPGVAIMQAIPVGGPEAIDYARDYAPAADYLILDSYTPAVTGIGASGHTHDWSISRAIVEQVTSPVILAGGLSPDNVADAIRAVRPWGVDSLTHTNHVRPDGTFRKDIKRVQRFVAAVRSVADS
jgi:phosphoribosylanthranilate isomerase